MERFTTYFQSPIGTVQITGTKNFITSIEFIEEKKDSPSVMPATIFQCRKELEEYFSGKRNTFSVKLKPEGTAFQQQVWKVLKKIKYGETDSYLRIAKRLNNPGAVRAVGLANGKNPIAIIIPCHRVVGGDGGLTGYAGGMWRKKWLLEHEGNTSGKTPTLF